MNKPFQYGSNFPCLYLWNEDSAVLFQCKGPVIRNSKLFLVQLAFAGFGQCQVYRKPLGGVGLGWGERGGTRRSVLTDCIQHQWCCDSLETAAKVERWGWKEPNEVLLLMRLGPISLRLSCSGTIGMLLILPPLISTAAPRIPPQTQKLLKTLLKHRRHAGTQFQPVSLRMDQNSWISKCVT